MKKASVHILFLFATLNVFAQTPAHVDVWGMRPEAGQTIRGHVYLDSISSANCIVMEKNAQGKTVNATCTDENGCFVNNWTKKRSNARKELVEYLLTNLGVYRILRKRRWVCIIMLGRIS